MDHNVFLIIQIIDHTHHKLEASPFPFPIAKWVPKLFPLSNGELFLTMGQSKTLPSIREFIGIECGSGLMGRFVFPFLHITVSTNPRDSVPSDLNQIHDEHESALKPLNVPHFVQLCFHAVFRFFIRNAFSRANHFHLSHLNQIHASQESTLMHFHFRQFSRL
jgi:hypothetical protein